MKILIDAAHGKNVQGKCSPDGTFREYKWSREICCRLSEKLTGAGIENLLIVPEDTEPGLWERVSRMNKIKGNALVISIHCNAAGMGDVWRKARGFSIWTSRGKTKSDEYADMIWEQFDTDFPELPIRRDLSDGDNDYEANFVVLLSRHPSVLIETLFMDNKEDAAVLNSEDFKSRFIECLLTSIKSF
jgi:N-acetylmuramoyl-L-alanine amidase